MAYLVRLLIALLSSLISHSSVFKRLVLEELIKLIRIERERAWGRFS